MSIKLIPAAPKQQSVLDNLFQLYAHDFTDILDLELGADGRFTYKELPLYWRQPNRYPFLLKVNNKLAGFVLVKKGSGVSKNRSVWDMVEFFVVRKYRRRGVGIQAAHMLWRKFPGPWELRVMQKNVSAHRFWQSAIKKFTGRTISAKRIEKDGERWNLFAFESSHSV